MGKTGDRLELKILGYEFPDITSDPDDSNWLIVQITADTRAGSWTTTDASLMTTEVASLSEWLSALADGRQSEPELDFLEPNLSFELVEATGNRVRLRAWFELELRPLWARWDELPARDLFADLELTRADLAGAAEALQVALRQFPARAVS